MREVTAQHQPSLKMTFLGNFILEYKEAKSNWRKIAREMSKGQLIETAKEIVERTLIFHQEDGEPYSALSCPVHAACTEELFRRDRIDYGTLMKMEMKAAQIGRTKRKKRVKKRK